MGFLGTNIDWEDVNPFNTDEFFLWEGASNVGKGIGNAWDDYTGQTTADQTIAASQDAQQQGQQIQEQQFQVATDLAQPYLEGSQAAHGQLMNELGLGEGDPRFSNDPYGGVQSLQGGQGQAQALNQDMYGGVGDTPQALNQNMYADSASNLMGQSDPFAQSKIEMGLAPGESNFQMSPQYQSALDAGMKSATQGAANTGMLFSGQQLKDLQGVGQGVQNQAYGDYLNRLMGVEAQGAQQNQQHFSNLMGVADRQLGQQGQQFGQGIAAQNQQMGLADRKLGQQGQQFGQQMGLDTQALNAQQQQFGQEMGLAGAEQQQQNNYMNQLMAAGSPSTALTLGTAGMGMGQNLAAQLMGATNAQNQAQWNAMEGQQAAAGDVAKGAAALFGLGG